ncbi:MAG: hypothetical protein OCC49_18925 [Fibrobacterales bacterium]
MTKIIIGIFGLSIVIGFLILHNFDFLLKTNQLQVIENGHELNIEAYQRGKDQILIFLYPTNVLSNILLIDHSSNIIYSVNPPREFLGIKFYNSDTKYPGIKIDDGVKMEGWEYKFKNNVYKIKSLDSTLNVHGTAKIPMKEYRLEIRL